MAHATTSFANCWEHEVNKDKRPKNWKKKEDMEVGTSNFEVLLGCLETSAIKSETDEVLFKTDPWELALKKLNEILVPNNTPIDNENDISNTNMEET